MPENVILNHKGIKLYSLGNVRLVTQYSFPKPSIYH